MSLLANNSSAATDRFVRGHQLARLCPGCHIFFKNWSPTYGWSGAPFPHDMDLRTWMRNPPRECVFCMRLFSCFSSQDIRCFQNKPAGLKLGAGLKHKTIEFDFGYGNDECHKHQLSDWTMAFNYASDIETSKRIFVLE
jgi:hypothetical protein